MRKNHLVRGLWPSLAVAAFGAAGAVDRQAHRGQPVPAGGGKDASPVPRGKAHASSVRASSKKTWAARGTLGATASKAGRRTVPFFVGAIHHTIAERSYQAALRGLERTSSRSPCWPTCPRGALHRSTTSRQWRIGQDAKANPEADFGSPAMHSHHLWASSSRCAPARIRPTFPSRAGPPADCLAGVVSCLDASALGAAIKAGKLRALEGAPRAAHAYEEGPHSEAASPPFP